MFVAGDLAWKSSDEFQGNVKQISLSRKLKDCIFSVFEKVFRIKYHKSTSFKTQMIYEIITNIIITLQVNNLVWYPDLSISNWSSYRAIWVTLSYSSYDNICASFYIMNFCFYGTTSLFGIAVAFFAAFGIFLKIEKPIPILLIMIFEKFIWIVSTICFIPSIMILLMTFKYSIITSNTIEEYSGDINSDSLNYGSAGIIIVVLCFFIIAPIIMYSEIFSCDIKHVNCSKNIKARVCAQLDLEKKIFYVFICIFYITFGNPNIIILQTLGLIYSLYLMIKTMLIFPYYNIFENCIESCKMAAISLSLLIFLFGHLMDNATIIVNFNIFLQPITMYLVCRYIMWKYPKLAENINIPKNQYDFELKFRNLLTNSNTEDSKLVLKLFKKFSEMSHFQRNKLFVIWEFNYYFYIVKDERLARVKLSKIEKSSFSIEGDIQQWKIFNWLSTNRLINFQDINYLKYLKELNRIKAKDEELCYILIDLQSELSQKKPRIEKIVNLVSKTSININHIKKGFKNIIDKYKTKEILELYIGFLENIASDFDEAVHISNRENKLSAYSQKNEDQRLEKYGKDVGTMVISCSDESFGSILHINEKASQILKVSLIISQEMKFTNFLPFPYDTLHLNLIKDFFSNCDSTDIKDHEKLFFQDQHGFLIECNLLIKLTALQNSAYFLVSFHQKKIDRQIAIFTEEGYITAHTELFSYYIGKEQKSLINLSLSDLIPSLCIEKMKNYEPVIILWENRELAFIKIPKKIKNTVVNLLIVAYGKEEIIKWKAEGAYEKQDTIRNPDIENDELDLNEEWEKEKKKAQIKNRSISEVNFLDKTDTDVNTQNIDSPIEEINEYEKSQDGRQSKQVLTKKSIFYTDIANKLLIDSKRRIRILQWVLFCVILSEIATVIAIAAYMVVDVNHSISMSAFNRLGRLLYDIGLCSDYAQSIEKQTAKKYTLSSIEGDLNFFNSIILDLENIQKHLLDDFSKWTYCSNSDILVKSYIPIWLFHGNQIDLVYDNLYDAVSRFIANGNSFLSEIKSNMTHEDEGKFLMINGIGYTWDYLNKTMTGIVDCEIDRVKSTGINIKALLYMGISMLGVLILIVIGFIIIVSRKHDEYWNFILNKAQSALTKLKTACIDRLITAHGVDYASEVSVNAQKNVKRMIKTKIYVGYTWRLMIFLAIGASYYLLLHLYLYPKCETMMVNRPTFINTFNLKRSLLSRLLIFARDMYSPYFIKIFNNNYVLPSSKTMFERTAISAFAQVQELKNPDFLDLMSEELKEKAFERDSNSTLDFSLQGVEAATLGFIMEIISLSASKYVPDFVLKILADYSIEIQREIGEEFKLADRDSKRFIEDQLKIILDVMIVYSLAMCALFFFYYFPYLNYQINKLKKFAILPIILPMEAD